MRSGRRGRGRPAAEPAAVLRALAALTPSGRREPLDVTRAGAPFVWLGTSQSTLYLANSPVGPGVEPTVRLRADASTRRLAALDALNRDERLLREGWVFLCGRAMVGDEERRLCTPLLTHPVRLRREIGFLTVVPAGDRELTPLVGDPGVGARLEEAAEFGGGALFDGRNASEALVRRLSRLQRWVGDVSRAAGLSVRRVLGPEANPVEHRDGDELVAVVGTGVFAARDVNAPDLGSALRNWAGTIGLDDTAFSVVYGLDVAGDADDSTQGAGSENREAEVRLPLPLTDVQRRVVDRSRRDRLTVASGPPGCGKSHALVGVAMDAVHRGDAVLVATQSSYATEVLSDLLARHPGPTPVVFGNAEQRQSLAALLAGGMPDPPSRRERERLESRADAALAAVTALENHIGGLLEREALAEESDEHDPLVPGLVAAFPVVFSPDADLPELAGLAERATGTGTGFVSRWRRRRARRRLRKVMGEAGDLTGLTLALSAARARRAATELQAAGGTALGPVWERLARADEELRHRLGDLVDARAEARAGGSRSGRAAVAALAAALRAGRARRRELLRRLDAGALVGALPMWLGTVSDIEDLLPAVPGLFDLVVLDEASQMDQRAAATALLRARRAVVAGDPYQLRHVSFVGDTDIATVVEEQGVEGVADRLDVRRLSAYDLAAGSAPVVWLGDHFRSVPHLIGFSGERFYRGRLHVLTRHPSNEGVDVIDVIRVDGGRDEAGVNHSEVEAVREAVSRLAAGGLSSLGVVTPFRAQADALERMLLESFPLEAIESMALRVGTVHAFQGNEREVIIASFGLGPDEPPASVHFLEDANLFNVLVTRARSRMIVVTSLPPGGPGLSGAYLSYAERGPAPPPLAGSATPWIAQLAAELDGAGVEARAGYPVGRWRLDIAAGEPQLAVHLECGVAPGGPGPHIERHRQLRWAGWGSLDAYLTRFDGDAVMAALTVSRELEELRVTQSTGPRGPV